MISLPYRIFNRAVLLTVWTALHLPHGRMYLHSERGGWGFRSETSFTNSLGDLHSE